jgi:hypothetical protein
MLPEGISPLLVKGVFLQDHVELLRGKAERPRGEPFERCHPLVGTPLVKRKAAGDRLLDDIADTTASLGSVDPQPPEDGLFYRRTDLLSHSYIDYSRKQELSRKGTAVR